jgi:hypothetical protein
MTRFIEKPFSELPDENDTYLLIRKDDCFGTDKYRGDHYSMEYCTEGGWNTWKDRKGEVFADAEISAERLADHYKCWLKPVKSTECFCHFTILTPTGTTHAVTIQHLPISGKL